MADLPMSLFFVCVLNFFILLPATTLGENVVAWSQSSLNNKIASDMTIELVADIPLNDYAPSSNNSGVYISDIVNLTLIGNNYEINSQNMLRCLWVESSTISIQHMHVRSCTATGNLGVIQHLITIRIFYLYYSTIIHNYSLLCVLLFFIFNNHIYKMCTHMYLLQLSVIRRWYGVGIIGGDNTQYHCIQLQGKQVLS